LEKSEPIQLWLIMLDGILITRLIFGLKLHMSLSSSSVPLPASLAGAVTRTSDSLLPRVHTRRVMVRCQSGRWMVMSNTA
jgi:hypothetical protein